MILVPTIVSGGAGSRLWPLSREAHPKPFVQLPDGTTLIGRTFKRALQLGGVDQILTVTNRDHLFLTSDAYEEADASEQANTFLLEPFGRDTAAAVALATRYVLKTLGPDAQILILPADHLIADEMAFAAAVARGQQLVAEDNRIVTFGITPDAAETGYGYLEADGSWVQKFVEKPNAAKAQEFVSSGRHYWNSGMFLFSAQAMTEAMELLCPKILAGATEALEQGISGNVRAGKTIEIAQKPFLGTPAISLDYAVMEKLPQLGFVPMECGWSDIGSWAAIAELVEPDQNGNRSIGETILEDVRDCYVHAEDRLVGLVGVSDLVVVDTPDALLVAHRDQAQLVKTIYNRLKSNGHEAAQLHRTAHRPWGTYTVLEEGAGFKIKRIEVKPGHRLSLQAHYHRSEHWVVVSGTAKVVNGEREILLSTNQSTYIPCGFKHRLENPGILPLVLIEVQSGEYLGENDIVRFDDIYGRG